MMAEYIKREDVRNMLDSADIICDADGEWCGYCRDDINIDSIPSADVRDNVHGEWMSLNDANGVGVKCSVCGFKFQLLASKLTINHREVGCDYSKEIGKLYRYCPICGALMEEGGDNNWVTTS